MKTFGIALAFYVAMCTRLFAAVSCGPLPFQLMNGQIADATQVMANYNFITGCFAGAAASGNNLDITTLGGLTSPISPSQGGTSSFLGSSPSTGSANNQVVSTTLPTYVQSTLTTVVFIAGFTNTGPMTTPGGGLTVGTTPPTSIYRRTTDGLVPLAGGEIIANTVTAVTYDGTRYELLTNVSPFPIGTIMETAASFADNGFLLLQGQCVSSTTFVTLFTKLGSPAPGSCAAGQWPLPDGRGRVAAMPDSGGSANLSLICAAQSVGVSSCGAQNQTLTQANLPNVSPALSLSSSSITITEPNSGSGHQHSYSQPTNNATLLLGGSSTINQPGGSSAGTTGFAVSGVSATLSSINATTAINGGVTQTPFGVVQPTMFLNKQIKY